MTAEDRFFEKISPEPNSGCWLWTAVVNEDGYGHMYFAGRTTASHRVSWRLFRGEIPETLEVDHKCRTRACVNPDHLRLLTHLDNVRAQRPGGRPHVRRSHCPRGHQYAGDNLKLYVTAKGYTQRFCRACLKINAEVYRASGKPSRRRAA